MNADTASVLAALRGLLGESLSKRTMNWFGKECAALLSGQDPQRLLTSLPLASRHVERQALGASEITRGVVRRAMPGLEIERWTLLDAVRVLLICSQRGQDSEEFVALYEEAFRYADDGEQRALFRALPLLEDSERFEWRAKEGCRTNIVPIFEAVATDSPYPSMVFDELSWNQLCIKAIFIGAPLHRVWGLDRRLNPELARMALDLVEERRSAGRAIAPELWLCLGTHGERRAAESLEQELATGSPEARLGALLGLARGGHSKRVAEFESDPDEQVAAAARAATRSTPTPEAFAPRS